MIIKNKNLLHEISKNIHETWKTIGWTNGCFDIIHPWHIHTFREAKKKCDILIVGINSDTSPYWKEKPWRPINNENFRSCIIDSLNYVDFVFVFQEETPLDAIKAVLPDVLIKWGDYNIHEIVGYETVIANNGSVESIPLLWEHSSSSIIKKIITTYA